MKRILALLLAALLLLSLMACSGSEEEQAADAKPDAAESNGEAATNEQNAESTGNAQALPEVSLKELPATPLKPAASAKCQVSGDFNGAEIAGQINISYVGFIRGQWSDEDVFVFENPTGYDVSLELRLYPLDANGQRGQTYSRLITAMQPQSTILITSASLGYNPSVAYDMELTVSEVPENERREDLRDRISYSYTASGGEAVLTVENSSEEALNVSFITLLLKDGEVVYLDAKRAITHDETAANLAAGETAAVTLAAGLEFDACAAACFVEPG